MKKNIVELFKRLAGLLILLSINLLLVKTLNFDISFKHTVLLSISVWVTINIVHLIIKPFKYIFYLVFTFLLIIYNVLLFLPSNYIERMIDKYPKLSVITNYFYELAITKHSKDFIIWLKRYITEPTYLEIPTNYDIALMVVIYIMLSIIFLFLMIKEVKVRYLLFITVYFLIQWFNYTDEAKTYFNIYFVGLILYYYILNYKDKVALAKTKKFRYKQYTFKKNLLFGFIFAISAILISTILTILLPLDIINDKIETFIDSGDMFRNEYSSTTERFSFESTPFQNDSKLGGPIELDNTIVMEVKSDEDLYLRGRVKNIYNGSNWRSSNNLYYRFRNVSVDSDIQTHKIEINPISIDASTIFSPMYPVKIKIDNKKIFFNEEYEIYYKDKFFRFGDKNYTIEYVLPNEAKNIKLESEINLEDYLSLPEDLPKRIMELSKELTKSKTTDHEKIKTLETYLSKNYKYNLNVPNIPNGKDFVDYFLFEENQGYCTYYASALAVMGRTIGIPTRYVEGFLVHDKPYNKDYYVVKASDAHAWVEAYIEEYGWINLEPTSAYSDDNNDDEDDDDEDNDNIDSINDNNNDRDDMRPILDDDIINESNSNYNYKNDRFNTKYIILIVFIIIILVLLIRIITLVIRNRNKYDKVSNKISAAMYFVKIYKVYFIIEKRENDNVEVDNLVFEIFKRIPKQNLKLQYNEIVKIFNKALYSNNDIFDDEIIVLSQLNDLVNDIAIRRLGKFKYFVFKYIIGSI